jgi:hypothetical protein
MAKLAQNPRLRPPMSEVQKEKLRQAQLRYIAQDPRWQQHRAKIAAAQKKPEQREKLSAAVLNYIENDPRWPDHRARCQQAALEVTKLTLLPEELDTILAERKKGRTFEYIAELLCVSDRVIRRELKALDIPTSRIPPRPKAKRGQGHWRSFDA